MPSASAPLRATLGRLLVKLDGDRVLARELPRLDAGGTVRPVSLLLRFPTGFAGLLEAGGGVEAGVFDGRLVERLRVVEGTRPSSMRLARRRRPRRSAMVMAEAPLPRLDGRVRRRGAHDVICTFHVSWSESPEMRLIVAKSPLANMLPTVSASNRPALVRARVAVIATVPMTW